VRIKPLRSIVLGTYAPDRFRITLGPEVPIVDATTLRLLPLDNDRLSVLFHEYAHYLQNIATPAGYHSFRKALDLWRLFKETVDPDGSSRGSDALAPEKADWVSQFLAITRAFDGQVEPDLPKHVEAVSFTIAGVARSALTFQLGPATSLISDVQLTGEIKDKAGSKLPFEYHLGAIAVMEGVAHELDQIVARGVTGSDSPTYQPPPFPYHVLRKFILHLLPAADTVTILRLGCLSLLSNDPAGALSDLCDFVGSKVAKKISFSAAMDDIFKTSTQIHALTDHAILAVDIPEHDSAFCNAGTLGLAVLHVNERFRRYLAARKINPFLELLALTENGNVDYDGIRRLFEQIPPCAVLQESTGSDNTLGRDLLWASDDSGFALRDEMAVLHSALHLMLSHLGKDSILETKYIDPCQCPFYTCCSLSLRRKNPGICKRKPWEAAHWPGWPDGERCWYGAAVLASTRAT
jgi:hypothetical protein